MEDNEKKKEKKQWKNYKLKCAEQDENEMEWNGSEEVE